MPESWMSGGHQVNALRVVQDALAGAQRLVHQDTAHRVGQGKGQLVRLGVAQADGQAALRVPVDQQHFLPGLPAQSPGSRRWLSCQRRLSGWRWR